MEFRRVLFRSGTVAGDLARLAYGNQKGYNDLRIEEMMDDAAVAGLYAAGGTAAINTLMKVFPAFYRLLSGTQVPADIADKMKRVLGRQEATLRNKGMSEILYGKDVPTVDAINEQTRKFVEKLVATNATGIIATHDLSLCEIEKELEEVKNYYFDAQIIDNELYFDYTFKKGICQNMNASFLLKKMEIV